MPARLVRRLPSTLQPSDHPYLGGAWAPTTEEWDADDLEVEGQLPRDLGGTYLRNAENPLQQPLGRYHPFDGDGMVAAIAFEDGRARFTNRFVRTRGLLAEQEAGRALWSGIAEMPPKSERPGAGAHGFLKDSSSTDVVVHAGRALTSFFQCGDLYELDLRTLETRGAAAWNGRFPAWGVSAHAKVDRQSGELLWFAYSRQAPFLKFGVVDAAGVLTREVDVPLPGPRLPHDMAFTERFAILNDFPLFWDEGLLAKNLFVARMHDLPTRFAVVPRRGPSTEARWFEASPTYALHFVNAWEEGETITMIGYRQRVPLPKPLEGVHKNHALLMALIDFDSLRPQLWRWQLDLASGRTTEGPLDDSVIEFGTFDPRRQMKPTRFVYSATGKPGWFLFDGLAKHDLRSGAGHFVKFGEGVFGSEAPFAPRLGGTSEDDGYLLTFVTDPRAQRSACWVYAAQDLGSGPIAKIKLPVRLPSGTHACWTPLT